MKQSWRLILFGILLFQSCSSAQKRTTPELSSMEGKRVALVDIEAEPTPRSIVEVALINQLVKRGTFILVNKRDVESARIAPEQDPTDWKGIAKRAGAELALRAKVLQFDAEEREGYSKEVVQDSLLAQDRGDDGEDEQVYKVKSLTGRVRVQLEFVDLGRNDSHVGVAEDEQVVKAEAKTAGMHLPPKLRFLESIANEAFKKFFERFS